MRPSTLSHTTIMAPCASCINDFDAKLAKMKEAIEELEQQKEAKYQQYL